MVKISDKDRDLIGIFKALSNETRLQVLHWLKEPERHFPKQEVGDVHEVGVCVKYIQNKAGLSQSTVSQYLSELQKTSLVQVTRVGQWTYYKRNEDSIALLAEYIRCQL